MGSTLRWRPSALDLMMDGRTDLDALLGDVDALFTHAVGVAVVLDEGIPEVLDIDVPVLVDRGRRRYAARLDASHGDAVLVRPDARRRPQRLPPAAPSSALDRSSQPPTPMASPSANDGCDGLVTAIDGSDGQERATSAAHSTTRLHSSAQPGRARPWAALGGAALAGQPSPRRRGAGAEPG